MSIYYTQGTMVIAWYIIHFNLRNYCVSTIISVLYTSKLSLREAKWPGQLESGDIRICTQVEFQNPSSALLLPLKSEWASRRSTDPQTWQLFKAPTRAIKFSD